MNLAYLEALESIKTWDYPIWALIIDDNWEIITARNKRNTDNNKKSHAEINLLEKLKDKNISNKKLYVTLEPCKMCSEKLKEFWITQINYILNDPINGWFSLFGEYVEIIKHDDNNQYLNLMLEYLPKDKYLEHREYFKNNN